MKIYLSGAITNDKNHKLKFKDAKAKYEAKGYKVLSPIETKEYLQKKGNSDCLIASINMLAKADIMVMLDNPNVSRGMQIERMIADYCDITVISEKDNV